MSKEKEGLKKIQEGTYLMLQGLADYIGIDPEDENFKDTPSRVARSYEEIFAGGADTEKQIANILKTGFPGEGYDEIILVKGIKTFSMCPHHFLPVEYDIDIAYIPGEDNIVLGISKLPRIAQILSKRPVLQESLTKDIGEALQAIKPLGVAVRVSGIHYCMRMRGVKVQSATITSYVTGCFREKPEARAEFFNLIKD
jgi:GTP cyclohydrolase I